MAKSFHCDHCGESVSPDEERCPHCGRFFRAVKCPVCAYTGKGAEFLKGCPSCGYLTDEKKGSVKRKNMKSREFLRISKIFAYSAIVILSLLLVYLLFLYTKI
jgi:uncharacterized membrane protein YvbJ